MINISLIKNLVIGSLLWLCATTVCLTSCVRRVETLDKRKPMITVRVAIFQNGVKYPRIIRVYSGGKYILEKRDPTSGNDHPTIGEGQVSPGLLSALEVFLNSSEAEDPRYADGFHTYDVCPDNSFWPIPKPFLDLLKEAR